MNKRVFTLFLLIAALALKAQTSDNTILETLLAEDENVRITLLYYSVADIGDPEWLKLRFDNKTNEEISISGAYYSIIQEERYSRSLGQGNMYDLLHIYNDIQNPSESDKVTIAPGSTLWAWKFLTNHASVLIDNRHSGEDDLCARIELRFRYLLNTQHDTLSSSNGSFCMQWVHSDAVDRTKLTDRLREVILNPHRRSTNSYVTRHLMHKPNIVEGISNEDLIEGVLLREDVTHSSETVILLEELTKRNESPNGRITKNFKQRIEKNDGRTTKELKYYWDNSLLEPIISSRLNWHSVRWVLEFNSKSWAEHASYCTRVYAYLAQSTGFKSSDKLVSEELPDWARKVHLIATSRDFDFIQYLVGFLDEETTFEVEDWSRYRYYGVIPRNTTPDTVELRVRDVAFVALLHCLDQFEFVGTDNPRWRIHSDLLPKSTTESLNREIMRRYGSSHLLAKEIRITPKLRDGLMSRISAISEQR